MADIDLTRVPRGELSWTELIGHVAGSDDRVERYFLEVKSQVDLNDKRDQAKVAKFILGAANRDPQQAGRRFEGHALMVLGVAPGRVVGIPPFEAKDLAQRVGRWVGADGPRWDFERVPTAGEDDVIVIVVDPPTGAIWTCRADGDGLADGDIYVRGDGDTRKATGDEIRVMLERASQQKPEVDVEVELVGEVAAVGVDRTRLAAALDEQANALLDQVDAPTAIKGVYLGLGVNENRSKARFREQVEEWKALYTEDPAAGVAQFACRILPGIRLRITNRTRTFLSDVRLDVEIDGAVRALEWDDRLESGDDVELFPGRPKDWGTDTIMLLPRTGLRPTVFPRNRHGVLTILQATPPRLRMVMTSLRPQEEHLSEDDEVILAMVVSEAPTEPLAGRWRLTAAGINDIYEGSFTLPVSYHDWREPIETLL